MAKTIEEIWEGDLFDRKTEATQLQAYIESVTENRLKREDSSAFTIALNAPYGVGKTFFLKRLAQHLALNHPVAYVDAWKDDLADEPLTALAATLKIALAPFIKGRKIKEKWNIVLEKTGEVAKIVGWGLAKKAISIAITAPAVEAISQTFNGSEDSLKNTANKSTEDVGKDILEDAEKAFSGVSPGKLMTDRIDRFEDGQKAIEDLKDSLRLLIESLDRQNAHPPIIVIIDELDRCRPTYAVKLLEEIKHLFDVPGLVFILGMNADQLSKSLCGAYGPDFDGSAYLRRFIQREYSLSMPSLEPLLKSLINSAGIHPDKFTLSPIDDANRRWTPELPEIIAKYMNIWDMSARDTFQVVDLIQTASSLSGRIPLISTAIIPEILTKVSGKSIDEIPAQKFNTEWKFVLFSTNNREYTLHKADDIYREYTRMLLLKERELHDESSNGNEFADLFLRVSHGFRMDMNRSLLGNPKNYQRLLEAVGRFNNPNIAPN